MKGRFYQIIVIGYGKTAEEVLDVVAGLRQEFGYEVRYIEHEVKSIPDMRAVCEMKRVAYERITDKTELTERLLDIAKPTLIISAGNYYLFPKKVIEQSHVEIINFHNALLPKIPGRNATTWAIYLKESTSGATWHYVTPNIDDGAIIEQKAVPITDDMKAWELSRDIIIAALELFRGFYKKLLEKHIEGKPQPKCEGKRKIYYSYEIPNYGLCSVDMRAEDIYRLLRSVDYGKNDVFPPVRIRLADNQIVFVKRYMKMPLKNCLSEPVVMNEENQCLYFRLSKEYELKVSYKF